MLSVPVGAGPKDQVVAADCSFDPYSACMRHFVSVCFAFAYIILYMYGWGWARGPEITGDLLSRCMNV
jgi:hypothetical protein